jgi:hypothetical protein
METRFTSNSMMAGFISAWILANGLLAGGFDPRKGESFNFKERLKAARPLGSRQFGYAHADGGTRCPEGFGEQDGTGAG